MTSDTPPSFSNCTPRVLCPTVSHVPNRKREEDVAVSTKHRARRKSSTKDDRRRLRGERNFSLSLSSYLWCEQSVQREHPRPLPGKKLRVMRGERSVEILPCHRFLRRLPRSFLPVGFDPTQKRGHFLKLDGTDGGAAAAGGGGDRGGVLVVFHRGV